MGCPWRVAPASVFGCVRCGRFRVWTPVSCTVCCSTGDSAGAPGLFRVDADISTFGSEDATPRSRVCVRVRVLLGRLRRARLPGLFGCGPPLLWLLCPSALPGPLRAGIAPFLSFCLPSFFSLSLFSLPSLRLCCPLLSVLSGPGCPRPWPCVTPPLPMVFAFSWFFCRPLDLVIVPPPVFSCRFCCFLFSGGFFCPNPLFVFCVFSCWALRVLPLLLCFLPGLWLLPCGCCPPPSPGAAPSLVLPPSPPRCVFCGCRRCRSALCVLPLLFCPPLLAWRSSAVLAAHPPPPPQSRCPLCCLVSPRCAILSSGVLRCCGAVFWAACCAVVPRPPMLRAAVRCAVFFGAAFCV